MCSCPERIGGCALVLVLPRASEPIQTEMLKLLPFITARSNCLEENARMVLWIPAGAHHWDSAHGAETASIWSKDMAVKWRKEYGEEGDFRERGKEGAGWQRGNENERVGEGSEIDIAHMGDREMVSMRQREQGVDGGAVERAWERREGGKGRASNETKDRQTRTLRRSTNWQPVGE